MNLLLISDATDGVHPLMQAVALAGLNVVKQVSCGDEAVTYIKDMKPDALVIACDVMDTKIFHAISSIQSQNPLPILVFTHDGDANSIEAAMKAGASSYIVDCHDTGRLKPLLEVAFARFKEQRRVVQELDNTKQALADRKKVDKAKGILMKQKGIDEDQAYKMMRKLAMSHNKRLGELAEQIIVASELLVN